MIKTLEQLERERRNDPCANCVTPRTQCQYGCGGENHWAARYSPQEIKAQEKADRKIKSDNYKEIHGTGMAINLSCPLCKRKLLVHIALES